MTRKKAGELLWRYGLASACIAVPLLLFVVMQATLMYLVPNAKVAAIPLSYILRDEVSLARPADPSRAPDSTAPTKDAAKVADNPTKKVDPDPKMQPWVYHIAGRYNVVVTIGFICLVSFFAALFGLSIIYQRAGRAVLLRMIAAACLFAVAAAYALYSTKFARVLVLDGILNVADAHPKLKELKSATSTVEMVNRLIFFTNFVGYAASGLVLGALAVLSVRASPADLKAAILKWRRDQIRIALVLASVILAVAVISTKILLQWPLSLLIEPQTAALNVVADAIVLRWGALGTITLVAAVIPALVAWSLDVEAFRSGLDSTKTDDKSQDDDGLNFAVMPAVAGILTVLAPVLASPFIDALKSLAGTFK